MGRTYILEGGGSGREELVENRKREENQRSQGGRQFKKRCVAKAVCAKKNGGSNKTDEKETSFESGTPIGKPDLMGSKEAD